MIALAELLELLHGASGALESLEAEYRDWSRPQRSEELLVDPSKLQVRWRGGGLWPKPTQLARRVWFQEPDRLRVEVMRDGELVRFGVRNGLRWWRWSRIDGASAGEVTWAEPGVPTLPPLLDPPLLDPARLLAAFVFEPPDVTQRAGRKVLRTRARFRRQPRLDEESYEFEFDAEYGTLLRRVALDDGNCIVQSTEALHVRYDAGIDDDRFVFVSP